MDHIGGLLRILFVVHKSNQPLLVSRAPKGITYFGFITD